MSKPVCTPLWKTINWTIQWHCMSIKWELISWIWQQSVIYLSLAITMKEIGGLGYSKETLLQTCKLANSLKYECLFYRYGFDMCTIDNVFTLTISTRICLFRIQEKLFWLETPNNEEHTLVARWFCLFRRLFLPLEKAKIPFLIYKTRHRT